MRSVCALQVFLFLSVVFVACDRDDDESRETYDVAECDQCDINSTCDDSRCICDPGFEVAGSSCEDINECRADNGGCDANAWCLNNYGSSSCQCQPGFVGDGVTCRAVWTRVASLADVSLDVYGWPAIAASSGSRIYFAPTTGQLNATFMRYFDVHTNVFSEPLALPPNAPGDFCACGYTEVFLGTPERIFLMGNSGHQYNVNDNTWDQVLEYTGDVERGEAAAAYDSLNHVIILIGGRYTNWSASVFDVETGEFRAEPGTLPLPMDSAIAYSPPDSGIVYVGGGDIGGFLKHEIGTDVWTVLPEAPEYLGRAHGMGQFGELLWVARYDGDLLLYDPALNEWLSTRLSAPPGFQDAVMVDDATYALVSDGSDTYQLDDDGIAIYRLTAIE